MAQHVTIEKIIINVGKKKLELSAEEAKELNDVLNGLLGHKVMLGGNPTWIWYPPVYEYKYPNWTVGDPVENTFTITNTNYTKGAALTAGPGVIND
jgi:hypothetical protein